MIDLKNTTFIIPIRLDSQDRVENLNLTLSYIFHHFDTNVVIFESNSQANVSQKINPTLLKKCEYYFEKCDSPIFHRTQILNKMIRLTKTKVIANYDCDVLFEAAAYKQAETNILNGRYDFYYPFNGDFYDIQRTHIKHIKKYMAIEKIKIKHPYLVSLACYGGCIFASKKKYIHAGLENENFKSYGYEDWERYNRLKKLGYKIERSNNALYHLHHERYINSLVDNQYYQQNVNEYHKTKGMTTEELRNYIQTWPWASNTRKSYIK